jgi:hypothetical protein
MQVPGQTVISQMHNRAKGEPQLSTYKHSQNQWQTSRTKSSFISLAPLYCNATSQTLLEKLMSTATIAQAQNKGLRQQFADIFGKIRDFAIELYAAHGGWVAQGAVQDGRSQLLSLAAAAESHSPALSAELRNFASK